MSRIQSYLIGALAAALAPLGGQTLDDAEVRIPYGELKRLLAQAKPPDKVVVAEPVLRSVMLTLALDNGLPVLTARFGVTSFGDQRTQVPLIRGGLSVRGVDPADTVLASSAGSLWLSVSGKGNHEVTLTMLPVLADDGFRFSLPDCPSALLELADGEGMEAVTVSVGDGGNRARPGGQVALPSGVEVVVGVLNANEVREVNQPEVPSTWTWQNQALVVPGEDSLIYQVVVRGSADAGSAVSGFLPMPKEAMDVDVVGEDLVTHARTVGSNGQAGVRLEWRTRGILERRMRVCYRMPLRPLDHQWVLEAPGGETTRTRFSVAEVPLMEMTAEGLSAPLDGAGLPGGFVSELAGRACRQIEGGTSVTIGIKRVPVVAVEELAVSQASWNLRLEPDGAMLVTGLLDVEHQRPVGLRIDVPKGMKLLSCDVAGKAVAPAALDGGWLKVPLASTNGKSKVGIAFTGRSEALDPVSGTLDLALPMAAHFIRSLEWGIDLPTIYQAEVHGNLTRVPAKPGSGPSRISLVKNLCRDERPTTKVFYQRHDINP